MNDKLPSLDALLASDGPLARSMDQYEDRPDQLIMANAVKSCCQDGGVLLIEAGTGTGKSLAYLLPILKHSLETGAKVLVSTCTKTLQNQIMERELPFIERALGWSFKYCLCLGGENYLCRRRFRIHHVESRSVQRLWSEREALAKLNEWAGRTQTGVRDEMDFSLGNDLWEEVKRTSETCMGNDCRENRQCFYQRARREQQKANVLVANHHLFFTNLKTEGKILPPYDVVVFDEAHDLEDIASNLLGLDGSTWFLRRFVESIIGAPPKKLGFLDKRLDLPQELRDEISQRAQTLLDDGLSVLSVLQNMMAPTNAGKCRLKQPTGLFEPWKPTWNGLLESLDKALKQTTEEDQKLDMNSLISWGTEMRDSFQIILETERPDCVYWAEFRQGRFGQSVNVAMRPLDVADRFRESVLDQTDAAIFVSATLSIGGKFDYLKSRLGILEAEELVLSSPFDYEKNVLAYVDTEAPPPGDSDYIPYLVDRIGTILKSVEGGSFVLFTSHITLRQVYEEIQKDLGLDESDDDSSDSSLMRQGEVSRDILLRKFREKGNAVLFGAASFWQGVDVPGQALQCVIMTRLPFDVPDEPIVQARMEKLTAEGKHPFWSYQIPNAIIRFRQGFGRLVRKKDDRGVIAILDSRIVKQNYGKYFRQAVPKCRSSTNVEDIERFFKEE